MRPRFVRALGVWICDTDARQVVTQDGAVLAVVSGWHGRGDTPAEAYSRFLTRQIARMMR